MWYLISVQSPKSPKPRMFVTDKCGLISTLIERDGGDGYVFSITSVENVDDFIADETNEIV